MNNNSSSSSCRCSNNLWMKLSLGLISLAFAKTIEEVSSFTPLHQSSSRDTTKTKTRRSSFLQSSIASPGYYKQEERKGRRCSTSTSSTLRQLDANVCTASSAPSAVIADPIRSTLYLPDSLKKEKQRTILQSMSMIELKLACSRRGIQYGKFASLSSNDNNKKKEYIEAILKDMEYSITGLIRPGSIVELTGDQLDEEIANCRYRYQQSHRRSQQNKHINKNNNKKKDQGLILVDVFATWCGPCRIIQPFLEDTARQLIDDNVRVVQIDSDKHAEWTGRYKVQGLPTILLVQNGKVIDQLEGTYMTDEILSFVQKYN